MSLLRPSKPLKLLALLLATQHFAILTTAQIAGFFPEYLKRCIDRCQPLWSVNYDCTLAGSSSQDCLCQSPWVEQFYEGSTCTCTSDFEATEFRNWFEGTNGCSSYVEARIQSSEAAATASPTSTSAQDTSSAESSTSDRATTSRPPTTTSTDTSTDTTPTSSITGPTTGRTTLTTSLSTTTNDQTASTTSNSPSIATSSQQDNNSSGFITAQNRKWVIPTITIGGLIVVGAAAFAILYFFFGCCRRGNNRGRYARTNNPAIIGANAAAAGSNSTLAGLKPPIKRKKHRMWLSTVPFFGVKNSSASQHSDTSQDMSLVDDHDAMLDTAYYGAGGPPPGRFPPYFGQNAGGMYIPYQHGAPLPPIDEVQSIAESHRDRGMGMGMPIGMAMPMPLPGDEDGRSSFSFENSVNGFGATPYTPVGGEYTGGGMMPPPAPVATTTTSANAPLLGTGEAVGAGLVGAAISTSDNRGGGDPMSFPNRYEDLAGRRGLERRMFDPAMMAGMPGADGGPPRMMIPRKEVRGAASSPVAPPEEVARSMTVSPPSSEVSSLTASSSGFGGGGGRLAGRGEYPRPPAPAGSGLFSPRRGEYYEDYS
ncbi:hypothetical protein TWF696_002523 [Orbilia brochopaga]|uniref:Extracellular membrane protein CFEM domain-containing protein n=1 Tax=Orbilia brochopaga TaxID=3140254 RepID=A0AAV9U289_9PEZI